jgi:hypothetical protein
MGITMGIRRNLFAEIPVSCYIRPKVHTECTIRTVDSARLLNNRWRRSATWGLLGLYLLTGPVIEAVHSEPACISSGPGSRVAIHAPGEGNRRFPVDQSHVCAICTQLTERLTTPAVPYHLSPLRQVSFLAVPVIAGRPVPVQYFSPDKRGPPSARV